MDALSDVLRVLRFSGGVFLDAKFRAPWCIRSQVTSEDCAAGTAITAGLIAFHYVLDGSMQVRLGDDPPHHCVAGDLIVIARNEPHLVGSALDLQPLRAEALIRKAGEQELAYIDFGTGAEVLTGFVCGYLASAVQAHPLLETLPGLLVTNMRQRACGEWVESSFRYAAHTHAMRQPGSQDLVARLSEMLFVEAVREHIDGMPAEATGWLAALRDPPLARALALLHGGLANAWTTEQLAAEALMSRSAFAERFVRTVGVPPMTYLTRWRMQIAAQRLHESPAPIARIAAEVGYESESTFTRAFTRELGVAPGAYRRRRPAEANQRAAEHRQGP